MKVIIKLVICGRAKSLKFWNNANKKYYEREKILKANKNTQGYYFISLCKNNTCKRKTIHRLIAENFLPNPDKLEQVNHINGIKTDNRLENLEWCTRKYNIQEAWRLGLVKQRTGKDHHSSKAVNQYDLNNNFIKRWDSMMDIQREKGFFCAPISYCCKGERRTAYGFIWKYAV